jgi:hypothetical protein
MIKNSLHLIVRSLLIIGLCKVPAAYGISVSGLKIGIDPHKTPLNLENHPLFGPLACPPLVRFDAQKLKFEKILVKSIVASSEKEWALELKAGRSWWSGKPITHRDLEKFIENNLERIVGIFSGGAWETPDFDFARKREKLFVRFDSAPKFGPYILATSPFFKKETRGNKLPYECAGPFRMEADKNTKDKIHLFPSKELRPKRPITWTPTFIKSAKASKTRSYRFHSSSDFPGSPWLRMSDEAIRCPSKVAVPSFGMIFWNAKLIPTNKTAIRKALTTLTPRGELLRAGGGNLGDIVSAPILRRSPSYLGAVLVHPFSLERGAKMLSKLGFTRSNGTSLRKTPSGNILTLNVATSQPYSLLAKVIRDAFQSVGIQVNIVGLKDAKNRDDIHGYVTGVVDWSSMANFWPLLNSSLLNSKMSPSISGDFLAKTESYAKGLSFGKHDKALIHKVHRSFQSEEPATVLSNFSVCLKGSPHKKLRSLQPNAALDPLWLIKLMDLDRKAVR